MAARTRLILLLTGLAVAFAVFWIWRPVSEDAIRDAVDAFGVAAPLAYVPISALLGALLVPGPLLAGAAGALFGTATGFAVVMAASVLGALIAFATADRVGRAGVEDLDAPRTQAAAALLRRHGLLGVIVFRLAPILPDAPCSYLFGLTGIRAWQVALGTAIGAAPRGLSYVALGDGFATREGTVALFGAGLLALTGLVGAAAVAVALRRAR